MSSCLCSCFVFIFFFKQKTAYEMRISDWSSDVCSSDLGIVGEQHLGAKAEPLHHAGPIALDDAVGALAQIARGGDGLGVFHVERDRRPAARQRRSEERRVGKEGVSTCRSRWSPDL